jgi:multicomponent Na+:H+ antiporter subunit D
VVDPELVPALLVVLPLLAAAVLRVPGLAERAAGYVVGVGVAGTVAGLAGWLLPRVLEVPAVHVVGGWEPRDGMAVGVPLVADGVAAGFVGLAAMLVAAGLVYLSASHERRPVTLVLTLLLLGAFNGFVLAGDLLSMFVFLELFGVTVYAITAGKVEDPAAMPSAINLAVVSTTGAVLFLMGAGLLYRLADTPNLAEAGRALAETDPGPGLAVAVVLLLGGLAVKAGLVPFHFAHVDLHTSNWSPHAGLFGAVMLPVGAYGIVRIAAVVLPDVPEAQATVTAVLLTVAVVTALVGGIMSLVQDQLKRLLAFSSVAHLGIASVGLALLSAKGVAAAGLYVVGHGLVKVALLLVAGVVLHRLGTLHLGGLTGRGREVPGAVALLALGAPLLAGLPPSGLFVGKAGMGEALEAEGLGWLAPVLYLAAALTGAALARAVVHLWTTRPVPEDDVGHVLEHRPEELLATTPSTLLAVPGVLLVVGLALPLAPVVLTGAGEVGAAFLDHETYRAVVLQDPAGGVAPAPGEELEPFKADSVLEAVVAALLAVGLGGAVARWWRREPRAVTAPLRWLRRAHTGLVNDQMTWVTVAMAGWCVVALVRLTP